MQYFCNNIFSSIPRQLSEELTETIFQGENVKIERIISKGHTTPEGEWYDQDQDEWVLLLQGQAILAFEDSKTTNLVSGDYLYIPAHVRHRVEWTDPERDCIWLAVHINQP